MIYVLVALAILYVWPTRRLPKPRPPRPPKPQPTDEAMVVDLVAALLNSGSAIPAALEALGASLPPGKEADEAVRAGRILLLGGEWNEAWSGAERLTRLASALEPAWTEGAPPVSLLRRAAAAIRARRMKDAQEAAARLGVRLVMPLGLCFLPAFFLIGIVPIILALGASFF